MRRLILLLLLFAAFLSAASFKLYLKDGDSHIVREYKVEGDTVRFYSVDRSEWEEMPLDLVDLKKTEAVRGERQAVIEKQARAQSDEDEAARAQREEIRKIPVDPGLYRIEDGKLRIFPEPETVVHSEKGRNTLKHLAPIPVFSSKSTLEINGEHSANVVHEDRPEFYLQLASFETFAIVEVTPVKAARSIERIAIDQLTKEMTEERKAVPIFQKQLSENGLYKLWPQESLPKGEYVVMEYSEGKMNQRVWDFRVE